MLLPAGLLSNAQGRAEPMVDPLTLVLLRQSSGPSNRALLSSCHPGGDTCKAMSWVPVACAGEKTLVNSWPQQVFDCRKLEELCLFSIAHSLLLVRKAWTKLGPSTRVPLWRSSGGSQSFEKELENQELSLRGVFIPLFSENHFLPWQGISLPKYKLPSKEITTSR